MLFINYKGDTPQQRFYSLGVKGNHNANKIRFIVARQQADIDLSDYVCNLKIENKEVDFSDLVMLNLVNQSSNELTFEWVMTNKDTQFRNLELQLEFLGGEEENSVVWQTLIVGLELSDTLKVGDNQPSDKELSVLKQVEKKINDLNIEVDDLKQSKVWKYIEVQYNENINETTIYFPRGILPLYIKMGEDIEGISVDWYFDYYQNSVLDWQGNVIEFYGLYYEDMKQVAIVIPNADLRTIKEKFYYKGGRFLYLNCDHDEDWWYLTINTYKILKPLSIDDVALGYMPIFKSSDTFQDVYNYWNKYRYQLNVDAYFTFIVMEDDVVSGSIVNCEFFEGSENTNIWGSNKDYMFRLYDVPLDSTIATALDNATRQEYAFKDGFWFGTQDQYDNLDSYDNNVVYYIIEG